MQSITPLRRLPLQGTRNTRDLGGYPCEGGVTRWRVFLRSDNPSRLTEADLEYLKAYGVDTAVDLRQAAEGSKFPSRLACAPGFACHQVSVKDDIDNIDYEGDVPGTMSGLYIDLLDNSKAPFARVMRALAAARGGALFHCAVGKDRTGVVAMLLLQLCGVADADIIADYAITDIYMTDIYDQQAVVFDGGIPDYVLRSVPASMERVLRHLRQVYGGAAPYLARCGLSPAEVQALREKLVQPG